MNNGQEALDRLSTETFDLVLMDIQMPVMDGLEAALRIRQREASEGLPRTPIVAMTAHAMAEDRRRCMAADMDGHLSKPIDKQALRSALATHAHPRAGMPRPALLPAPVDAIGPTASDAPAHPPSSDEAAPGPRSDIRNEAEALAHLEGDHALLRELQEMFLATLDAQLSELAGLDPATELGRLGSLAHAFKGAVGAVGAVAARRLASDLELAGRAGDTVRATRLQRELHQALRDLQQDLQLHCDPATESS